MEIDIKIRYVIMLLLFAFSVTGQTLTFTVTEDIEIQTDALPNYPVDINSSDLELSGFDHPAGHSQVSFLRFTGVSIPAGATITDVRLKFFLKNSSSLSNIVKIAVENSLSAVAYPSSDITDFATGNDILNTRQYSSTTNWGTPINGIIESSVLTPSLLSLLPSGMSGNTSSIAFRFEVDTFAELFNVHSQNAPNSALYPQLIIEYTTTSNQFTAVVTEDIEIRTDLQPTSYPVYINSSDLELSGSDTDYPYPPTQTQISYLRFENVSIPSGATITNAQLKFFLKNSPTQSNTLQIAVENSLSAAAYPASDTGESNFTIGNEIVNTRQYSSGVNWTTAAGSMGSSVLTPNLVTDLPAGLSTGQLAHLAFRVTATRVTAINDPDFFNGHSQNASNSAFHPQLIIDYTLGPVTPEPVFVWSGALTDNSINVRAKLSTAVNNCTLVVSTDENDWSSPLTSSSVDVTTVANLMGSFTISGLAPSTNYFYRIKIGSTIATNLTGKFKTAPSPAAIDKSFTFVTGACNRYPFGNVDNLGVNLDFYTNMKNENPLFLLSSGDLHYGNPNQGNASSPTISNNRKAYEYLLFGNLPLTIYGGGFNDTAADNDFFGSQNDFSFGGSYDRQAYTNNVLSEAPKMKAFFQDVPMAYIWDDHDFSGDGSAGTIEWGQRGNYAKQTYRDYVPHYPFPINNLAVNKPIYQAYTIGNIRFILTDVRSEQTDAEMMSSEQICWFKKECLLAKKNNQLISWVTSIGPTSNNRVDVNDYNSAEKSGIEDRWGHTSKRTQRNSIFQWLKDAQIQNLFIIAGDAHAMGIDDGQNTDCDNSTPSNNCGRAANATSPRYPLFQTAPLIHDSPSHKFITTSLLNVNAFNTITSEASRGHYTKFDVIDAGSGEVTIKTSMKRIESGSVSQYSLTTNSYTKTEGAENFNPNSYIENGNTYVFKRNLIEANPFSMTQDSSIVLGSSAALSAICTGGTLSWYNNSTALVEASSTVSPTVTTTYTAKCDVGCSNIVELGQVTITVLSGSPCGYNQSLAVSSTTQPAYTARGYITTSGNVVYSSGNKEYVAGKAITLTPPVSGGAWETSSGTVFQAKIDPNLALCNIQVVTLSLTKPVGDANTHLSLTWSNPSVSFVGSYRVEYAPAGGSSWTSLATVSTSNYQYNSTAILPQFVIGSVYKFRVVAVTTSVEYPSIEKSVTCANTLPPSP